MSGVEENEEEVVERDLIMVVEDEDFEEGGSGRDSDGSPSPKKIRTENDDDDDDGFLCMICYCPFTNSGEHRISCLACGHIFGKSCITRWLRTAGSCPQCNDKARKKDIRVLYTKHLKAMDTAERDRALQELEMAKVSKQQAELEIAKLKLLNSSNLEEINNLREQIKGYQSHVASLEQIIQSSSASSSGSNIKAALDKVRSFSNSKFFSGDALGKSDGVFFKPVKQYDWKGEECRVAAFSEWSNAFVISHKFNQLVSSGLSKSLGGFGVRIMNWADPKKVLNMPVHQKEIRDMAFSPNQTDLLLTVGMDNKACLTNVHTTLQVINFTSDFPIWSCAFSTVDPNLIYAGLGNGQIMIYDIRKPKETVDSINFPHDKTPVCRIHFVPPSYQQSGFSSCGLLVQKLTTCWFVEFPGQGETSFHQLPFEGGFLGIDFEPVTRHILVSTRPTPKNPTRHMVCEMTHHKYEGSGAAFGCNVVKTYTGGSMLGKMYRPKIFSPAEGKVYVTGTRTNTEVDMWDIAEHNLKQTFRVNNAVLDYVPVKHNDNYYINFLSSDGLETYKY